MINIVHSVTNQPYMEYFSNIHEGYASSRESSAFIGVSMVNIQYGRSVCSVKHGALPKHECYFASGRGGVDTVVVA